MKFLVFSAALCLLSCKTTIYKYGTEYRGISIYVIKTRKHNIEFYEPSAKNQTVDLDIFRKNKDSIKVYYEPYIGFSYRRKIRVTENEIFIDSDTLKLEEGIIQPNKNIFDPIFAPPLSFSGNTLLRTYKGNVDVEYLGDSIYTYRNQDFEKIFKFRLTPCLEDSSIYPVTVFYSSKNGIPVYFDFYKYPSDPFQIGIYCIDYNSTRITKRKLKQILL